MSLKPQEIYLKSVQPMMLSSSSTRTPYVAVSSFSILSLGPILTCAQASAQIQYISHFLNTETTFDKAQDLFKIFLRTSPCVELWTFYCSSLNFRWIIRQNNIGNAQRDDVRKSYEFTLNHVGQDKDSGEIWSDYIQFLQSGEVRHLSCPSSAPSNSH